MDKYKYTKKYSAPSWLYLEDYTEMYGQQYVKNKVTVVVVSDRQCTNYSSIPVVNTS